MNLQRMIGVRNVVYGVVVALCGVIVLLAVALAARAFRPRPIVVVPRIAESRILSPGEVPDEAARGFALLYVTRLENYTPSTVAEIPEALQRWVSPTYWARAADALERRRQLSIGGRMSCQAILPSPERLTVERGRELTVIVPVFRRVLIADQPAQESHVVYRLVLEPALPDSGNPYGLLLSGQRVEEVAANEGR